MSIDYFQNTKSPFTEQQTAFLNGLFHGYALRQPAAVQEPEAPQTPLHVLYGSQSGTAESLSKTIRKMAPRHGYTAQIAELNSISLQDLAGLQHLLIIAATHGDGEPTDNAQSFFAHLMDENAPALPAELYFSVCGLGDSSYPHFNRAAKQIDARLAELGASRVAELVTCDVDYDNDFASWSEAVFATSEFTEYAGKAGTIKPQAEADEQAKSAYNKDTPFLAHLISSECLSGSGSGKQINHIAISLAGGGSDMAYQVGDALGVSVPNNPKHIDSILKYTGLSATSTITYKNQNLQLYAALYKLFDLLNVTAKTAEAWNIPPEELQEGDQLIDLLAKNKPTLTAQQLVDGLRPLQPRLYSISSSPNQHPGEVHLTIRQVVYNFKNSDREGLASNYLGKYLTAGNSIGVYIHTSPSFRLPEKDTAPIIMIGPGTGIAPFRAFLEEREYRKSTGKNWLFFGDQHATTDFLYQEQITEWQRNGLLSKLSLAWSRDSKQKTYVQHLIAQEGELFCEWLENGAYIYICGDASSMAKAVEETILEVVARHIKPASAQAYLDDLRKSQRYQRDVY